jgi:peptide/nickel transport system ATP-binding protein
MPPSGAATAANDVLLEVKGLKTHFFTDEGVVKSVDGVDFVIPRNKTLCVVGESGSGKSITARSILQIIDSPGRIVAGEILLHRHDGETINITKLHPRSREIRRIRGKEIAMIFQEPMSSLSPVHTIGNQIIEAISLHLPVSKREARDRAVEALRRVGIPRAEQRLDTYPFQLSGGMRQRAMIAMALSCEPSLLIADEPTTALDVTTQANILDLIKGLQGESGMSVMFITHDLGVVAEIADDVVVMYLGIVAERGDVDSIFHDPQHPYTQALLRSIPKIGPKTRERLESIKGMVPHPFARPAGCPFHTRCDQFMAGVCNEIVPPREAIAEGRDVRCLLHSDLDALGGDNGARSVKRGVVR